MKVSIYEQLVRAGATRRDLLKGAASVAALAAASTTTLGTITRYASAQANLRAEMSMAPRTISSPSRMRDRSTVLWQPSRHFTRCSISLGSCVACH